MSEHFEDGQSSAKGTWAQRPEALGETQRPPTAGTPQESVRLQTWIANAESQAAIRRALMDCYNG